VSTFEYQPGRLKGKKSQLLNKFICKLLRQQECKDKLQDRGAAQLIGRNVWF